MKKYVTFILVLVLSIGFAFGVDNAVKASDLGEYIDGSYLINDFSSEGISSAMTRGVYLGSGSSSISKAGTGKIVSGGTTVGNQVASTISVTVRVERLVNGKWQVYTSWSSTKYSSALVNSSKTLSVPTGYYYRTHSFHSANSDSSSSITNGLWI